MRKFLSILLALTLMLLPMKAMAEGEVSFDDEEFDVLITDNNENNDDAEAQEELPPLTYDYDELVVGTLMPMYGNFTTALWGNSSSDADVRDLIHAYNLVQWDNDNGGFILDESVVSGSVVTENGAGDHTYTLALYDDLYYSDGSPITARDYAFSFLLRMAPEIEELGGTPMQADYIVGYEDYVSGAANSLSGIRVIDDNQLSITLAGEYLPFFYEVALLDCIPLPIGEIAPGCIVADDGDGVYIRNENPNLPSPFTAELLERTLLDETNGYLSHPRVTSGPWRLLTFENQEATFEINEYYKGDAEGYLPVINRLVFRLADRETMLDELMNCDYGLLNKVTRADDIQDGMRRLAEDGRYTVSNYQRTGLSYLSFCMEKPGVSQQEVRQAIAMCLDKDGLTDDYVSNFGLRVDGYYGMGQWMVQMLNGTLSFPEEEPEEDATAREKADYEEKIEQWEALVERWEALKVYDFDPQAAAALLEQNGWRLNGEGIREKNLNGETVTLDLVLYYPEENPVGAYLEERLVQPLQEAGIRLKVEPREALLEDYYSLGDRGCDMLYLASNFETAFEPSGIFEPGGEQNHTRLNDAALYDLAVEMRRTEPGDLLSYCEKWLNFQEEFIDQLPLIPVYSNVYFDFYPRVLHDYTITASTTWSQAVVGAYMSDIEDEEEEEEAEPEDDDGAATGIISFD